MFIQINTQIGGSLELPIKLNVPVYESQETREFIKSHGARWNPNAKTWYIPDYICNLAPFQKFLDSDFKRYIFNPRESYFILGYVYCHSCEHQNLVGVFASSDYKEHLGNHRYTRHKNLTLFGSIIESNIEMTNWMCSLTNCFQPDELTNVEFNNYCNNCGERMLECDYINEYTVLYPNRIIDGLKKNYVAFNICPLYYDFSFYCHEEGSISEKATNYLRYLLKNS